MAVCKYFLEGNCRFGGMASSQKVSRICAKYEQTDVVTNTRRTEASATRIGLVLLAPVVVVVVVLVQTMMVSSPIHPSSPPAQQHLSS